MCHLTLWPASEGLILMFFLVLRQGSECPLFPYTTLFRSSTVQVELAGVGSVLPAGSVARTAKLWLPSASAAVVCGLVEDIYVPPSMRHSKVEPGSLALKLKLGVALEGVAGALSTVVVGGV